MAAAWNKAMEWIDDEEVFTRLNTLMTVAKEATDRVMEATMRAEMNITSSLDDESLVTHPEHRNP